ncbi:sensor histidine kinase [Paraburkholderia sp. MM5477-R1]|uniref:sensor histidine kinase n=1 Tax=Paraburkholderia sp. MM5477-R1 TaxID=2991062 RepID=UPI003D230E19
MKLRTPWPPDLSGVANEAGTQIAGDNRLPTKNAALRGFTIAAAIAIFIADSITSLDIAAATLYVAVVLMASRFLRPRDIAIVGLGCIALALLSWYITPPAVSVTLAVANEFISIGAIALVTVLARHAKLSEAEVFNSERRLRDVQKALAHANRLTTMGELMASLSHELKQPISASATNAQAGVRWLAASPPNLESARQSFERIIQDAARASAILERTRELSRKSASRKNRVQLNDAIAEVLVLLQHEFLKENVAVEIRLDQTLPPVEADRVQLQQVVLNLAMNAVEAMSEFPEGPRKLIIQSATVQSGDVLITVQDSGPGFAAENADRLFETFYTTKTSGIGMGLAICRSIVEDHGGRLWADTNQVARGSVFRFTLPRSPVRTANSGENPVGGAYL